MKIQAFDRILNSVKYFLERTTPLGILSQQRRQKRGKNRPTKVRVEEKGSPPLPIPSFSNPVIKDYYIKLFSKYIFRIDYILIWGHGLKYKDEIIDMIRSNNDFRINKILYHRPKSVRKLVKAIYSYDYAPLNHLKSKTRYLMKTPKEALFIFFENHNPNEDYYGKGIFRHYESSTLKAFKEKIRNRFNEKIDGKRTEDHVIHASDNQLQTHYILRYLGFKDVDDLREKNVILNTPFYMKKLNEFVIKKVPMESLFCNIAEGDARNSSKRMVGLKQSPHYLALAGNEQIYNDYINRYFNYSTDYSLEKYNKLAQNLRYLAPPFDRSYIVARRTDNGFYKIHDGLHRAAILCYQGFSEVLLAVF